MISVATMAVFFFTLILAAFLAWWPLKLCCDWFDTGRKGYGITLITMIVCAVASGVVSLMLDQSSNFFLGETRESIAFLGLIVSIVVSVFFYSKILNTTMGKGIMVFVVSTLMTLVLYALLAMLIFFVLRGMGVDLQSYANQYRSNQSISLSSTADSPSPSAGADKTPRPVDKNGVIIASAAHYVDFAATICACRRVICVEALRKYQDTLKTRYNPANYKQNDRILIQEALKRSEECVIESDKKKEQLKQKQRTP